MIDALMYGIIPREKTAQFSRAPPLNKLNSAARPPPVRLLQRSAKPFLQNALIHAWRRDRSAQTHNHNHGQRKQNAPAQLRYLDGI